MDDFLNKFLTGVGIGVLAGQFWGFYSAHQTLADECTRLNGFYVGDRVFQCEPKREAP
jgi:hypothetical protein